MTEKTEVELLNEAVETGLIRAFTEHFKTFEINVDGALANIPKGKVLVFLWDIDPNFGDKPEEVQAAEPKPKKGKGKSK